MTLSPSDPKEIDDLKLEAKHTIDMVRFVDEAEIDSRFKEKSYYLTPDGDQGRRRLYRGASSVRVRQFACFQVNRQELSFGNVGVLPIGLARKDAQHRPGGGIGLSTPNAGTN